MVVLSSQEFNERFQGRAMFFLPVDVELVVAAAPEEVLVLGEVVENPAAVALRF